MVVRIFIGLLGLGLTVLIVSAALDAPISQSFGRITSDLWGWTTIADLYLGFILIAVIIAVVERRPLIAALWIIPLFALGNVWSAVWFVLRWPRLVQLLRGAG